MSCLICGTMLKAILTTLYIAHAKDQQIENTPECNDNAIVFMYAVHSST